MLRPSKYYQWRDYWDDKIDFLMSWVLTWITVSCLGTRVTRQSGKTIYRIQNLYSSANPEPLFFLLILHLFLFLLHAHFCLCFDQEQTLVQQDEKGAGEEALTQVYRKQSENSCILPLEASKKFSVSHVSPARVERWGLSYSNNTLQQPPSPCPAMCHAQLLDISKEASPSSSLHPRRRSLAVWMLTVTLPTHLKAK